MNVTTCRPHSDRTTILNVRDHEFIRHESVIYYADARFIKLARIVDLIDNKQRNVICRKRTACKEEVLTRICDGLLVSRYTPKRIKAYCQQLWADI